MNFEEDDTGILVKVFDKNDNDENRYTRGNIIYKSGKSFIFQCIYFARSGDEMFISILDSNKWDISKTCEANNVTHVVMTVYEGLQPFINYLPNYNQTIIKYEYQKRNGEVGSNEMTGLIENEKNIWLHPPRAGIFKILELCPYPYIKYPFVSTNTWRWNLKFTDHWSDQRWLEWTGDNENICTYRIIGTKNIITKLGRIKCLKIESTAESRLGKTALISYYNKKFGFVKLEYDNIDGSKIIFELVSSK